MSQPHEVGPIVRADEIGRAVVEAIRATNPRVKVVDQGSYFRVTAPLRCRLTRDAVERILHAPFHLPGDLEAVMPSFKGRFRVTETEALWVAPEKAGE